MNTSNFRILLVKPYSPSHYSVPPLGLAYLATAARKVGAHVDILDLSLDGVLPTDFASAVAKANPDLLGIQMYSCDYNMVGRNLDAAKKVDPSITTVVGGAHPSAMPAETLEAFPSLDYVIRGEGEIGFSSLVGRLMGRTDLDLREIPGLVYREGGLIRKPPPATTDDLDELGFPSWDLIDPRSYRDAPEGVFVKNVPVAPISTSRGCPYSCTFCASHTVMGKRIRTHSVGHIVDEIAMLCGDFGVREIHIEDDNFTMSPQRVLEFCDLVKSRGLRFSLTFPNGVRLDTLSEEVLVALREIGCYSMIVGIESGSQRVLNTIKKRLTLSQIRAKVSLIHRIGIEVRGFFILGFPTETRDEMLETIRFATSLELSAAQFSNFVPLPGTEAARSLSSRDELGVQDWDKFFFHRIPYSPTGMSPRQLKGMQRRAYLTFYGRPKIILGLLSEISTPRHLLAIGQRLFDYLVSR